MASTFIIGTEGADLLNGAAGNDTIRGLGGNDTINGSEGNDDIDGGDGNDSLIGGAGNDIIQGGKGADTILGGAGDDVIRGGKGSDSIDGGDGNDTIYSGYGNDTLTGGAGSDVFVLKGKQDAANPAALVAPTITDFVAGTDTIAIEGVTAAEITAALAGQTTVDGGVSFKIGDGTIVVKGAGLTTLTASNVVTEASIPAAPAAGQTFTLTTGVDVVTGTSGNDTIIADNTGATATLSVADQINGGGGTDTLKIYLAAAGTTTGQPTLTSIENVYINGGIVSAYTAAAGTTGLHIDAPVLVGGTTLTTATYTVNGQSVTLQGANVTVNSTTNIAGNTPTSLALALNGWTKTGAAVTNTVDLTGTAVATLNLSTTGAASNITLANTGAALKTVNISGDQAVTVGSSVALTTVNASTATGAVTYNAGNVVGATFAFTGGTGNDTITFVNDGLATLASGAQLNGGAGARDKIGLFDTAVSGGEAAKINAAVGFEILGLNAAITLDASALTSIKHFSIDTTALTQTISNISTGTIVDIATGISPTALTIAPAVGVNTVAVNMFGGSTAAALNTAGITTINLSSTGTTANVITALGNSDNTALNITGTQALTVTLAAGTAAGSLIDGSAFTGKLTATGSGFNDVIKGGTAGDVLTGGAGADTLTGGAGNDTFIFASKATTQGAGFAAGNTTAANIDHITDFNGGGAAAGDVIQLSSGANAFGAALTLNAGAATVVTAVTVATAADFTALAAAVQAASAGVASAAATVQVYDVTVTGGTLAGRYAIVNDENAAIAATDTFLNLTGITGSLHSSDFTVV